MKKIIIFLMFLLLSTGAAFAQKGLNSLPVFQGKVIPERQMVMTEVRGDGMATYKLSYYRSVRFQVDTLTARKVAALVEADALTADSAETEKTGELLTYGLVQLKPLGITRRYLCYQARPTTFHGWMITIIYLEGSATLQDLRSMFEKQ
ncbi:MAG: hypothetical protein IKM89_09480 [Bacteroidales bacterium]|jgi:hypothetical protein|nr:hypothetical protein [Bacteroidales bacterium]